MCNLCVFVRRREKFLHKQEINSKRGRKVCAKGATMSQTLWSVLVHSTQIHTHTLTHVYSMTTAIYLYAFRTGYGRHYENPHYIIGRYYSHRSLT